MDNEGGLSGWVEISACEDLMDIEVVGGSCAGWGLWVFCMGGWKELVEVDWSVEFLFL